VRRGAAAAHCIAAASATKILTWSRGHPGQAEEWRVATPTTRAGETGGGVEEEARFGQGLKGRE
jgi:hypothetical protein